QNILNDALRVEIDTELSNIFKLQSIERHQPFTLSPPSAYTHFENGSIAATVFPLGVSLKLETGQILIKFDSNSDVHFKKQVGPHMTDSTMKLIVDSYLKSIEDPQNEFVYLYEIREKLQRYFGTTKSMTTLLNIDKSDFGKFGKITCDEPIEQGRHRGKFENLRPATQEELFYCRGFIKNLIEKYAIYLTHKSDEQQITQN
ncbi:MAG TPA: hypothetical protein PKZ52_16940, partial [Cellvibrionaceae bacterium]|nr:hypothetical protein [Cellvibrionaceae bacterium]